MSGRELPQEFPFIRCLFDPLNDFVRENEEFLSVQESPRLTWSVVSDVFSLLMAAYFLLCGQFRIECDQQIKPLILQTPFP